MGGHLGSKKTRRMAKVCLSGGDMQETLTEEAERILCLKKFN